MSAVASRSRITCPDLNTFLAVVRGLVEGSIGFDADAATLTITLTGGY